MEYQQNNSIDPSFDPDDKVLILVLMEYQQNNKIKTSKIWQIIRLNPCCYGIEIEQQARRCTEGGWHCLNPCCFGIGIEHSYSSLIMDGMFILRVFFCFCNSNTQVCMTLNFANTIVFFSKMLEFAMPYRFYPFVYQ